MSDEIALQSVKGGRSRVVFCAAMLSYCLLLFLLFDFAYSSLTRGDEQRHGSRIAHAVYDHGFVAKFEGHEAWGNLRYPVITNSLGFKDASTRDVPLKSSSRRVLVMGDSFVVRTMSGGQSASVVSALQNEVAALQYPPAAASAVIMVIIVTLMVAGILRVVDVRKELAG